MSETKTEETVAKSTKKVRIRAAVMSLQNAMREMRSADQELRLGQLNQFADDLKEIYVELDELSDHLLVALGNLSKPAVQP